MSKAKVSLPFFDDPEVRAIWNEQNDKCRFSVLDIVAFNNAQDDYTKTHYYCKYFKAKSKREKSKVLSATTQLNLIAPYGKNYLTEVLDYKSIIVSSKKFPNKKANS